MELMIAKYIQEHKDWEKELAVEPYFLNIKEDGDYVLFKYNQYKSDMTIQICKEARGIIFNKQSLVPVCVPYFKFFNIEEVDKADRIDWGRIVVTEKIDGSLMKLWNDGSWHLSTNGTIDAFKAEVDGQNVTFGQLFVEALGGQAEYDKLIAAADASYCYMFELVHPKNQVVIEYSEPSVYLHGVRDMKTYEEENPNWFMLGLSCVKRPKVYDIHNYDEARALVNTMTADEEGIVIRDKYYHRVKVKSVAYLAKAFAASRGAITTKRLLKMWRDDMLDDFLAMLPEKRDMVDRMFQSMKAYVEAQEKFFNQYTLERNNLSRKDYFQTLKAVPQIDMTYIMLRYDNKISNPMDYYDNISNVRILKILRDYNVA